MMSLHGAEFPLANKTSSLLVAQKLRKSFTYSSNDLGYSIISKLCLVEPFQNNAWIFWTRPALGFGLGVFLFESVDVPKWNANYVFVCVIFS